MGISDAILSFGFYVGYSVDPQLGLTYQIAQVFFTPQPLRAVGVLFSPMVSGWGAGGGAGGGK